MKRGYDLFPLCDTSCWRNICTILFIPQGLAKFYWNSFSWILQLFDGLRYDFNKELARETNPGTGTHMALRIWNSKFLSRTKSYLEVRVILLGFSLWLLAGKLR